MYHPGDRRLAGGLVPVQMAISCDFAGFLLGVWHHLSKTQRLLFEGTVATEAFKCCLFTYLTRIP